MIHGDPFSNIIYGIYDLGGITSWCAPFLSPPSSLPTSLPAGELESSKSASPLCLYKGQTVSYTLGYDVPAQQGTLG